MRFHHSLQSKVSSRAKIVRFSVLLVAAFAIVGLTQTFNAPAAQADQFDEKIRALQVQIDGYNARASELSAQADTFNNKIAELQNQQAQLQAEIDLNNAKREDLMGQIAENETKLKNQSEALSKTLADIYYSQKTSTLDILMNSNSVSDYVDKAARQGSMKDQLSQSVNEINELKKQLNEQKVEVEKLIAQAESQKASLVENRQQQESLLRETQGQEAAYQGMIGEAKARQAEIQREQMAYIASLQRKYDSQTIANSQCGGGYPFCNAPPDSTQYAGGFRSYENARECVNYVQWRIYQITGRMERHGHANTWPRNLSQPVVNSVGVVTGGKYGHVVWVEEIGTGSRAGQIRVSEYNWSPFAYTERWTSANAFGGYYKNW